MKFKEKHTLLIVDDEPSMLQGLSTNIDWDAIGYRVVALLDDGLQAIEYLSAHRVDVLLSDIKMHGASGLDVAEYIYNNQINTRVVLLSGYREFEDARRALHYKVVQYITKPFQISELRDIMYKLARELLEERSEQDDLENRENRMRRFTHENFFLEAAIGALRTDYAFHRWVEVFDIGEEYLRAACILVRVRSNWKTKEIYNLLHRHAGEAFMCCAAQPGNYFQLVFLKEEALKHNESKSKVKFNAESVKALLTQLILGIEIIYCEEYKDIRSLALSSLDKGGSLKEAAVPEEEGAATLACKYIQEHYHGKITLAEVAEHVALNPSYLSRMFSEQTGDTFRNYVTNIRIQAAARLLVTTQETVYSICEAVGYTDLKHFYGQFKKIMQITPTEYRALTGR